MIEDGYTFVNLEKFSEFVLSKTKSEHVNLDAYLLDLVKSIEETGDRSWYELGPHETVSGHAELINFHVVADYDEEEGVNNYTITF